MSEWMPVSSAKPAGGSIVDVFTKDGERICSAEYCLGGDTGDTGDDFWIRLDEGFERYNVLTSDQVTHWMNPPPSPTE